MAYAEPSKIKELFPCQPLQIVQCAGRVKFMCIYVCELVGSINIEKLIRE